MHTPGQRLSFFAPAPGAHIRCCSHFEELRHRTAEQQVALARLEARASALNDVELQELRRKA